MAFKEKVIGLILILLGAWPFLLKVETIGSFFSSYSFLEVLTPGEVIYQVALVVLGVMLLVSLKAKVASAR